MDRLSAHVRTGGSTEPACRQVHLASGRRLGRVRSGRGVGAALLGSTLVRRVRQRAGVTSHQTQSVDGWHQDPPFLLYLSVLIIQ